MKIRVSSSSVLIVLAVVALLFNAGCCRKPPEELAQAQSAVAQAKENCAEVYAKEDYQKAYDTLQMAEKYAADRKCKDAQKASNEAIALAAEAEVRANEKKAELEAKAEKMMAEIEQAIEQNKADYAALLEKQKAFEKKREDAMAVAEDKNFSKYNITMDLPTVSVDKSIESDMDQLMADYEEAKAMYAKGGCNLFEVIDALEGLPKKGMNINEKIAANQAEYAPAMQKIDEILEVKLAELEEAMKPKFKTAHTVVKGDTLWGIAEEALVYNDPFKWPLIWWENKWTEEKAASMNKEQRKNLIKDPDLIYPGQNLSIKQEVSQSEIDEAIKYAKNRYGKTSWRDIPDFLTDGK